MSKMNRRRFIQLTLMGGIGMILQGDEKKQKGHRLDVMLPFLAKPSDFLVVQHDALNNPTLNLEEFAERSFAMGRYTNGRTVVPVIEGDLLMVEETGDLVFTHQNLGGINKRMFEAKKEGGKATYFGDVLKTYSYFPVSSAPVMCIELKLPTSRETIDKVHAELAKAGMGAERVYFDSFFGSKLDLVGGRYAKSLHLFGRFGLSHGLVDAPKEGYNFVTVPKAMSFGEPTEPMVYGAVGSVEEIEKAADNPLVLGVYPRIREGNSTRMFLRSIRR